MADPFAVSGHDLAATTAALVGRRTLIGVSAASLLAPAFARAASRVVDLSLAGADRSGSRDSTAIIQQALHSLAGDGGTAYFPPGTYLVSRTLQVPSNVTIAGAGTATLIRAARAFDPAPPYGFFIFTNARNPALLDDTKPLPLGTVLDHNIHIRSLSFDCSLVPNSPIGGLVPIALRGVDGSSVTAVEADTVAGLARMIGCRNYSFIGCRARGVSGCAFDSWAGAANATISGCYAEPRPNRPGATAVQFNGMPGFPSTSSGLLVDRCDFRCGISLDTLASECTVENVSITNTTIAPAPPAFIVIIGRGAVRHVTIRNCRLLGGGRKISSIWIDRGAAGGNYAGDPDFITIEGNWIENRQDPPAGSAIRVFSSRTSQLVIAGNTVIGSYTSAVDLNGGNATGTGNRFAPGRMMTIYGRIGTRL